MARQDMLVNIGMYPSVVLLYPEWDEGFGVGGERWRGEKQGKFGSTQRKINLLIIKFNNLII